jgi:hypothetical protein
MKALPVWLLHHVVSQHYSLPSIEEKRPLYLQTKHRTFTEAKEGVEKVLDTYVAYANPLTQVTS